ncbi:hypothetical protein [Catenuloplanes japonicus]|uniref:hypothetical protein n=1 Tax=Catenuloplanes japonicus TaxID=33876 RepID=UPI0005252069|nr:hypothetical protein [Catenuloplanes japonicus]
MTRDPRTAPGLVVPIAGPVRNGPRRVVKAAGFALLAVGAIALLAALPFLGLQPEAAAVESGRLVQVDHPVYYAAGGAVAVVLALVVIRRARRRRS